MLILSLELTARRVILVFTNIRQTQPYLTARCGFLRPYLYPHYPMTEPAMDLCPSLYWALHSCSDPADCSGSIPFSRQGGECPVILIQISAILYFPKNAAPEPQNKVWDEAVVVSGVVAPSSRWGSEADSGSERMCSPGTKS